LPKSDRPQSQRIEALQHAHNFAAVNHGKV
jgi:hypothetical protein